MTVALFDLDGTLTDPQVGITACIAHALERVGADVPARVELNDWIGAPLQKTFAGYLGSTSRAKDALGFYRERFAKTGLFENEPYEHIHDTLALIRGHAQSMFVLTSKPTVYAQKIVEHFGMGDYFEKVYGSELDGRFAEKTDLLAHVLEREGFSPASSALIGDRRYDVLAAKAHGLKSIGVLWGFGDRDELVSAGADVICETVKALPGCFAGGDG